MDNIFVVWSVCNRQWSDSTGWPILSLLYWGWLYSWSDPKFCQITWTQFTLYGWRTLFKQPLFGGFYTVHLSQRTWDKEVYIHYEVSLISWPTLKDRWTKKKFMTSLHYKCNDSSLRIVNFPFICDNISSAPAYGVFISQLIHYTRAWRKYVDFLFCARLLIITLLEQAYVATRLMVVIINSWIVMVLSNLN